MIDWLLAILHKPLAELTLLDIFKVGGTVMGALLIIGIVFALLTSKK